MAQGYLGIIFGSIARGLDRRRPVGARAQEPAVVDLHHVAQLRLLLVVVRRVGCGVSAGVPKPGGVFEVEYHSPLQPVR